MFSGSICALTLTERCHKNPRPRLTFRLFIVSFKLYKKTLCLSLTESCLKRGGENQDEVVDDSLCAQEEQPITAETCLLPCPAHCVTSEWSLWSKCTVVSLIDG